MSVAERIPASRNWNTRVEISITSELGRWKRSDERKKKKKIWRSSLFPTSFEIVFFDCEIKLIHLLLRHWCARAAVCLQGNMKLELMDREKGLELFGKFIRTKNVESLQGDQGKAGPEPLHPTDSKQKLQASVIFLPNVHFATSLFEPLSHLGYLNFSAGS